MKADEVDAAVAGGSAARTGAGSDDWGEDKAFEMEPYRLSGRLKWLIGIIAAVILMACVKWAMADEPPVDANLVTALDFSNSINAQESLLQLDGVAMAIKSPAVVNAILAGDRKRIGFTVFAWGDGEFPELVGWRVIASQQDAEAAAAELIKRGDELAASAIKRVGYMTNLSAALEHSLARLQIAPFPAKRSLVNVVGNGPDNVGEDPSRIRSALIARGATINGVVVGGKPDVMAYYRAQVIGGRYAFVLPASSADDMASAFIAKFVTEIAMLPSNSE